MKQPSKFYLKFSALALYLALNLALTLGFPAQSFAQDFETEEISLPEDGSKPRPAMDKKAAADAKDRKLKISFDDELVKGQQATPEADFIFTRAQFNYKRMIRLRENFIPEVKKGKDEFRVKH